MYFYLFSRKHYESTVSAVLQSLIITPSTNGNTKLIDTWLSVNLKMGKDILSGNQLRKWHELDKNSHGETESIRSSMQLRTKSEIAQ